MSRALLGGLLLFLAGCATTPPTIGPPAPTVPNDVQERTYQLTLARYSGRGEVYASFDTRLFAGATLQTPAFREARVRRIATFKVLPPARAEQLLAEELAEAALVHEVWLGVHVNESQYEDFDQPDSIWRVALVTPTGEATPLSIERVGRANLDMRAMYPYMGTFWVGYRVRYPRELPGGVPLIPPDATEVLLRLASTIGRVDLKMAAH